MVGMRVYVVFCACVANIYVDDWALAARCLQNTIFGISFSDFTKVPQGEKLLPCMLYFMYRKFMIAYILIFFNMLYENGHKFDFDNTK